MFSAGKHVVITGGGPAGSLAAIAFAKRGFTVDVHERRELPEAQDWTSRSYRMMLNQRGQRALKEFGIDISHLADPPFLGAVAYVGSVKRITPSEFPGEHVPVSRAELTRLLIDHACGQFPDRVKFHFDSELEDLNVAARTATFARRAGNATEEVKYDLLVGADGSGSRVRSHLAAQVPGFQVAMESAGRSYKAYFRALAQPGFAPEQILTVQDRYIHNFILGDPFDPSAVSGLLTAWIEKDGQCCGLLSMSTSTAAKCTTREDYEKMLQGCKDALPESFRKQITDDFMKRSWERFGTWVTCSQLHGPHCMLMGDAAHSVTPRIGEGCNSSLEDATILAELLVACNDDLEQLPAAFTRRRLADAHALVWLDMNALVMRGFSGKPWELPRLLMWAHQRLATIRHRLLPFMFELPSIAQDGATFLARPVSYREPVRLLYTDGLTLLGLCALFIAVSIAALARVKSMSP